MAPADLADLTPPQLTRILTALAADRYGPRWKAPLAREFGYSNRTVIGWSREEYPPPIALIIALHHLQHGKILTGLAKLAADLQASVTELAAEVSRLSAGEAS